MEKISLGVVGLSSSQAQVGSFTLVLSELNGPRRIPIIIGGFEAQAIALEMEGIKPNRPMTHDLIFNIANLLGIKLLEVIISDLNEGIFFATLVFRANDSQIIEIDSRPSDAIALSVRFKAPIYTYEHVLSKGGVNIEDSNPDNISKSEKNNPTPKPTKQSTEQSNKQELIKKLTQQMEEAITNEDYELAAKLRDQLSKLGNS